MFCYQCEQTGKGTGCTTYGQCGKDPLTADLQDLLVYAVKCISAYANRARAMGAVSDEVDVFVIEALFTTVTNVNFDPERVREWIIKAERIRDKARTLYEEACRANGKQPEALSRFASWKPADTMEGLQEQGIASGIVQRMNTLGADITGLQELLLYGIKGAAAYAEHARLLGKTDADLIGEFHAAIDYLNEANPTVDGLLGWCLKIGEVNLKVMELLDAANTGAYGHPVPTSVRIEPIKGKAILVSGHDLKDLELLLQQTEGKGINVYTHGEMLPAHGYPELKKYKHLVGNYGGAWMDQLKEFGDFPGAVLMTTNCIQMPSPSYIDRLFTTGLVAWPGVRHIEDKDFTPVIEAALAAPGFTEDGEDKTILVGFGHNTVLGVADKVIEAVKSGQIQRFFLIGGCDGAKPGRSYYTEFAEAVPEDSVILTLACGKYRFNKTDFGTVAGLPRLMDIGQCNDAYSAIKIAVALAEAFGCGVNDLPLSLIISWYEQKACAILLTLLHLGIKNIRLGPSLPAFITPAALQALVDKFNIAPIGTVEDDIKAILAN